MPTAESMLNLPIVESKRDHRERIKGLREATTRDGIKDCEVTATATEATT